jgi:hypothetical protein
LLNILFEIPLQLVDVGVLLESGHLGYVRIVEIPDVVLLNFELLELPLDLWQIHINLFLYKDCYFTK